MAVFFLFPVQQRRPVPQVFRSLFLAKTEFEAAALSKMLVKALRVEVGWLWFQGLKPDRDRREKGNASLSIAVISAITPALSLVHVAEAVQFRRLAVL
jgi:hypothetical protein